MGRDFGPAPSFYGQMSEWFKELVLKTSDAANVRGFESHSDRQIFAGVSRLFVFVSGVKKEYQVKIPGLPFWKRQMTLLQSRCPSTWLWLTMSPEWLTL